MPEAVRGKVSEPRERFCAVNQHCLENIVRLSDEMEVTASNDIYDDRGVKLWAKGAPVSRSLQERMLKRRLRQPLECSLDIESGASMENVIADCFELMKANPALSVLGNSRVAQGLLRDTRSMKIPSPLKLLLTSAREHKRRNYDISLASMIICSGLAQDLDLSSHSAGLLILSALVHDIGEMYINPDYLDNRRELQPGEWKHVASHPCVGQAFLKEFTSFPGTVADCVLHHHERLDGSGYPFQLRGSDMDTLGKLICVADSASAIVMRGGAGLAERVAVALRIVPEEFPRPAVSFIVNTLSNLDDTEKPAVANTGTFADRILPTLQRLRTSRKIAEALAVGGPSAKAVSAGRFALDALISVDKSLRATGVYELSQVEVLENDPEIMGEVSLVLNEVNWRLRNLARNIYLRTEQGGDATDLQHVAELTQALSDKPKSANLN